MKTANVRITEYNNRIFVYTKHNKITDYDMLLEVPINEYPHLGKARVYQRYIRAKDGEDVPFLNIENNYSFYVDVSSKPHVPKGELGKLLNKNTSVFKKGKKDRTPLFREFAGATPDYYFDTELWSKIRYYEYYKHSEKFTNTLKEMIDTTFMFLHAAHCLLTGASIQKSPVVEIYQKSITFHGRRIAIDSKGHSSANFQISIKSILESPMQVLNKEITSKICKITK